MRTRDYGDVAVLGAGVIGLATAFELAGRGADVRAYDVGEPARAASWAAAGMLAPHSEQLDDAAMLEFSEQSLRAYPDFIRNVHEASNCDPQLRLDGVLHAAYDADSLIRLQAFAQTVNARGFAATMLSREQTLMAEPALGKHVTGAMLIAGEGHIDNRRLGRALVAACIARGVRFNTAVRAISVECDPRRVLGVRSDEGFVAAAAVINAAGVWAGDIKGVPERCKAPVHAVKGQMLALQVPHGFMRRPVWMRGAYLVPRADGRLLIGATVEQAQDCRVTAKAIHQLLHAALDGAPSLGEFTVTETWAGLRPGTSDGLPCIGETALAGYYLATGHYRNGILLAPATARLISDVVQGRSSGVPAAFSLNRFSAQAGIAR